MAPTRRSVLAVLVLVLAPGLAVPTAGAQSSPFSVHSVTRDGDNLTIGFAATSYAFGVTVSLSSGGSLVALPEQYVEHWEGGESKTFTFTLLRDVESATVTFRWSVSGESRSQSVTVPVPSRDAPTEGTPRLLVTAATLAGTALTVNVTNVGDGPTGGIVASIEDNAGRKIGSPYFRTMDSVAAGASSAVGFVAPKDLQQVTVVLEYASRTERVTVVVRHSDAGGGGDVGGVGETNVTLTTELPFREVEVGRTVDYSVRVANSGRAGLVRLSVDGLPSGYTSRFYVGGSSVPSILLAENQSRQITLSITVPNSDAEVDRLVEFDVVASVNGTASARLEAGVTVRGSGKLELTGTDASAGAPAGGTATFTVTVTNTGSAPVFDVELDSRRLYGWTVRVEPPRVDRLDPGESTSLTVELRAPDVIGPGRYPTDLTARAGDVSSRAYSVSVEVEGDAGGGGWLWLLFVGAMTGTLGFAAWWRRRG